MTAQNRPPLPPFSATSAAKKVRAAEDIWNSRDPDLVTPAYTENSHWRNRNEFAEGHDQIHSLLTRKWASELEYRLIKGLWVASGNRIAVRFAYEWHNEDGSWFRSFGNENWQFATDGRMCRRIASINDLRIQETDRLFRWPQGPRPLDHPELDELGL